MRATSARAGGVATDHLPDAVAAVGRVADLVEGKRATVLVKGSRGIALERVVEALLG